MILDQQAVQEMSEILKTQGWIGTTQDLEKLLVDKNTDASLRAFIEICEIKSGSNAYSSLLKLAEQYTQIHHLRTAFGIAMYLSNPGVVGDAACDFEFGKNTIRLRYKDKDNEEYSSKIINLID